MAHRDPDLLPDDARPDILRPVDGTQPAPGPRAWWRGLAGVLVVLVAAGVLVGGAVALVAKVGMGGTGGAGSAPDGSGTSTSRAQDEAAAAKDPAVADFESFAAGLDGVSGGDAAVVVELVSVADGETPRGTADVLLDPSGEGKITEVAAALTGWASEAEAAGRIALDVRLSTADGAVDLSRPATENADRLAVASEVLEDSEIAGFWIGASRVDLVLVAGADQGQARERWTARVGEIAPTMAVTVRGSDTD